MDTKLTSHFQQIREARFGLRLSTALAYTLLLVITLLQSSQHPVIGPAAPPGPVPLEREIMLTLAHFTGFSVLTLLWWWVFDLALPLFCALLIACLIALCISVSTELLQTLVPDRGASWWDIATNTTAFCLTASLIYRRMR